MILVDSHCHINFPELAENLPQVLSAMQENSIKYALVVSVCPKTFAEAVALVQDYPHLYASVGLHPADTEAPEFSYDELMQHANNPKVIGIGETGLDYHWCEGDLTWQHNRFRTHIQASKDSGLPIIIHTRDAPDDTIKILTEEKSHNGVIHCFTENTEFAKKVLDLGFYISFSGIVTFKNAKDIQEACQYVPLDRMLVETDSPYLAPVPYRGKTNQPAYVRHTAEFIANLRGQSVEEIAQATTDNFFTLFNKAQR